MDWSDSTESDWNLWKSGEHTHRKATTLKKNVIKAYFDQMYGPKIF